MVFGARTAGLGTDFPLGFIDAAEPCLGVHRVHLAPGNELLVLFSGVSSGTKHHGQVQLVFHAPQQPLHEHRFTAAAWAKDHHCGIRPHHGRGLVLSKVNGPPVPSGHCWDGTSGRSRVGARCRHSPRCTKQAQHGFTLGLHRVSDLALRSVHCTMYTALCTAHSVLCTLYTALCTLYSALCTLHSVHCTLRSVHCTLHTLFCSVHAKFGVAC
jgi:hypothetical protein